MERGKRLSVIVGLSVCGALLAHGAPVMTTPLLVDACGISVDGQCVPPSQCPEDPTANSPDQVFGACNTYADQQATAVTGAAGVTVVDDGYLEFPVTAAQAIDGTYEPPASVEEEKATDMATLQPQVSLHLVQLAAAGAAATRLPQTTTSGNEYPAWSLTGYQLAKEEDGKCGPQSTSLVLQWNFNGTGRAAPSQDQLAANGQEDWSYNNGIYWKNVTGPLDNNMNSVFGYPWYAEDSSRSPSWVLSEIVEDTYWHNFAVMSGVNPNGYLNWRQYHYTSPKGHYLTVYGYDEYNGGHVLIADPFHNPQTADAPYGFWTLTLSEFSAGVQHLWW